MKSHRNITRREFLTSLGAIGVVIGFRDVGVGLARRKSRFEMLVVGDSLIWGQGLREEQKFYHLTRQWIADELMGSGGEVNLNVKAHSGSTIKLDPDENAALKRGNLNGDQAFHPEVNVSFPAIDKQIESAIADYPEPGDVDLIMISGGIPDVGVAKIINPLESNKKLRERIDLYCRGHMTEVLSDAAISFPNAAIAIIGYYPIITRHTPMKRIVNDILELYNVPGWAKPLVNNPLKRNLWRLWKGKMIKRSEIWHAESTKAFQLVVAELNRSGGRQRAVFVPSPIEEKTAFGTADSLLFTVARRGRPADPEGTVRVAECRPALSDLRKKTDLKYSTRFCELASVGHPNIDGSKAYAESIKIALKPLLNGAIK